MIGEAVARTLPHWPIALAKAAIRSWVHRAHSRHFCSDTPVGGHGRDGQVRYMAHTRQRLTPIGAQDDRVQSGPLPLPGHAENRRGKVGRRDERVEKCESSAPEAEGAYALKVIIFTQFAGREALDSDGQVILLDAAPVVRDLGAREVSKLLLQHACCNALGVLLGRARARTGPRHSCRWHITWRSLSPPPLATTEIVVAPASMLFSRSSLSALAGLWIT